MEEEEVFDLDPTIGLFLWYMHVGSVEYRHLHSVGDVLVVMRWPCCVVKMFLITPRHCIVDCVQLLGRGRAAPAFGVVEHQE